MFDTPTVQRADNSPINRLMEAVICLYNSVRIYAMQMIEKRVDDVQQLACVNNIRQTKEKSHNKIKLFKN